MADNEQVWVAETGVLDTEFYAGGTETRVSVHRTRDGATRAVRARFLQEGASIDFVTQLSLALAGDGMTTGEAIEDVDGMLLVTDDDSDGEHEARFKWSWAIYERPISD